jgi:hypothetical protein
MKIEFDHTLSSLYSKDIDNIEKNVILIPYYPSPNIISNYPIHSPILNDYILHLEAMRTAFISGNILVYLNKKKSNTDYLIKYWKKYLQNCPVLKNIPNYYNEINKKYIVLFPHFYLSENQYLLNPSLHYELLSKETIIKIETKQPKTFVFNLFKDSINKLISLPYPYIIKITHGLGGYGTWIINDEKDFIKIIKKVKNRKHEKIIISELIKNVISNYCLQFYISKNENNDTILGITRQIIDENCNWKGSYIDYREQNKLKNKLNNIFKEISNYLRVKKYFGIVGVDILEDINNNLYVIDLNPRINGSTSLCLMKNHFKKLNINYSYFGGEITFKYINQEQILNTLKQYLDNYEIILLGMVEKTDNYISSYIILTGNSLENIYKLKEYIENID